ncbi:hypothetical protein WMY93_001992 [Mugilogobius chulae]|uniref:Protein kinase domain-containing protein n=1 Tax=Mugilogobius chulae TaxID=88201 RepID=A0AAW0PSE2_9GOBI
MFSSLNTGDVIRSSSSEYQLQRLLGSGAFGEVSLCRNLTRNRTVALKVIAARAIWKTLHILQKLEENDSDRFHIVHWFGSFESPGCFCHEFEKLDISLSEFLKKRPFRSLRLTEIRPIVGQMAEALMFLERIGILHCDIKPQNIMMVDHVRQPLRIKVIDFGIACSVEEAGQGVERQTLWYRAPETLLGARLTAAIDMWSLGCMAAEMFLGTPLFPANDEEEMMKFIVETVGHPPQSCLDEGVLTSLFYQQSFREEWEYKLTPLNPRQRHIKNLDDISERDPHRIFAFTKEREESDRIFFVHLLKRMLYLNPDRRISPEEVLQHSFISMDHLKQDPDYKRPQMPQALRERAIGMLTAGMSTRSVARALNVNFSTISRLQRRFREYENVPVLAWPAYSPDMKTKKKVSNLSSVLIVLMVDNYSHDQVYLFQSRKVLNEAWQREQPKSPISLAPVSEAPPTAPVSRTSHKRRHQWQESQRKRRRLDGGTEESRSEVPTKRPRGTPVGSTSRRTRTSGTSSNQSHETSIHPCLLQVSSSGREKVKFEEDKVEQTPSTFKKIRISPINLQDHQGRKTHKDHQIHLGKWRFGRRISPQNHRDQQGHLGPHAHKVTAHESTPVLSNGIGKRRFEEDEVDQTQPCPKRRRITLINNQGRPTRLGKQRHRPQRHKTHRRISRQNHQGLQTQQTPLFPKKRMTPYNHHEQHNQQGQLRALSEQGQQTQQTPFIPKRLGMTPQNHQEQQNPQNNFTALPTCAENPIDQSLTTAKRRRVTFQNDQEQPNHQGSQRALNQQGHNIQQTPLIPRRIRMSPQNHQGQQTPQNHQGQQTQQNNFPACAVSATASSLVTSTGREKQQHEENTIDQSMSTPKRRKITPQNHQVHRSQQNQEDQSHQDQNQGHQSSKSPESSQNPE